MKLKKRKITEKQQLLSTLKNIEESLSFLKMSIDQAFSMLRFEQSKNLKDRTNQIMDLCEEILDETRDTPA